MSTSSMALPPPPADPESTAADVAGRPVQFPGVSADAPGGSVVLSAQAGKVVADAASAGDSAARVDVSGSGDAGSLTASAPRGEVRISAADLAGWGAAGHLQGRFHLDGEHTHRLHTIERLRIGVVEEVR